MARYDSNDRIPMVSQRSVHALALRNNSHGGCQGFFDGPLEFVESLGNCTKWQSQIVAPLSCRLRFSSECQESVGSHIARLLFLGRPAAVGWFVIAILIGVAIQGMPPSWALPHVSEKVNKAIRPTPPLAHANASASVIRVLFAVLIVAPVNCPTPCEILRRVFEAMLECRLQLSSVAAATRAVFAIKAAGRMHRSIAAPALTQPKCLALLRHPHKLNHRQATILASNKTLAIVCSA